MSDLISRADAIEAVGGVVIDEFDVSPTRGYEVAEKALSALPSADAVQGEWVEKGEYAECSICGAHSGTQFDGVEPIPLKTNYCPNCGARMKGGDDE